MKRYGELQIGITVIIALIALIFGVVWFQGLSLRHSTLNLTVYFPQVSGLDRGDPVEVAGVVQGKVRDLIYEKGRAKLVLAIAKDTDLYQDARVRITNYGMMGQKFVAIDPGTPTQPPLDTSKPLNGEYEAGVAEIMSGAGHTAATLDSLGLSITRFMAELDSAGGGAALGRTLRNAERASSDVAELAASTRQQLTRAITDLDDDAHQIRALLDEKGPQVRGTLDNFAVSSARLDTLTAQLNLTSREVHKLVETASSKDGSLGALVNDRELYNRLLATVARTDSLLRDVQRNPRRYFKFSVF